jgi:hypothetical protein
LDDHLCSDSSVMMRVVASIRKESSLYSGP